MKRHAIQASVVEKAVETIAVCVYTPPESHTHRHTRSQKWNPVLSLSDRKIRFYCQNVPWGVSETITCVWFSRSPLLQGTGGRWQLSSVSGTAAFSAWWLCGACFIFLRFNGLVPKNTLELFYILQKIKGLFFSRRFSHSKGMKSGKQDGK